MLWIVGDIQGCAHELELLLSAIRFEVGRDQLWCAGDTINRGPDSVATLACLERIGARSVLGNHERYALAAHAGLWPRKRDTLDELFAHPKVEHWFRQIETWPVLWNMGLDVSPKGDRKRPLWLVHGGLHPNWQSPADLEAVAARVNRPQPRADRVDDPEIKLATVLRCCTADGNRTRFTGKPRDRPAGEYAWDSLQNGPAYIVHGHWARRGHYRGEHSIGLDSGCVYGLQLTAWAPESDEIVQIPAVPRPPSKR